MALFDLQAALFNQPFEFLSAATGRILDDDPLFEVAVAAESATVTEGQDAVCTRDERHD